MAESETSRTASDKTNIKYHKYTLDEHLQVVLESDDESSYSNLSDL